MHVRTTNPVRDLAQGTKHRTTWICSSLSQTGASYVASCWSLIQRFFTPNHPSSHWKSRSDHGERQQHRKRSVSFPLALTALTDLFTDRHALNFSCKNSHSHTETFTRFHICTPFSFLVFTPCLLFLYSSYSLACACTQTHKV